MERIRRTSFTKKKENGEVLTQDFQMPRRYKNSKYLIEGVYKHKRREGEQSKKLKQ